MQRRGANLRHLIVGLLRPARRRRRRACAPPRRAQPAGPPAQCFEGMKAYKDAAGRVRMFRPDLNMARLNASCAR